MSNEELEGRENFFDGEYVENLTRKNFKKNRVIWDQEKGLPDAGGFIMVYAGWCETCHAMRDWFLELSTWWENDIYFGGINSMHVEEGNDKLCVTLNVNGYPAFFGVSLNGKLIQYNGSLDREEVYEWMTIFREKLFEQRYYE